MDEISHDGWGGSEEADLADQVSLRGEHLWIDGVHISSWDCPECLRRETVHCVGCSFFDPVSCRLRYDLELRCDLKSILDEYRERLAAKKARQRRLISALRAELRAHGRPLHYTVLAQIMVDRHPALRPTESKVLKTLAFLPEIFEKTDEGVYQVRAA
jgi:hypothetical protein